MGHAFDCKLSISGQWSEQSHSWIIHNWDNPTEIILTCRSKHWLASLFENHARAVIIAGVFVKSFWSMILPRSVQNFKTIWQMRKRYEWTKFNEISVNITTAITGAFDMSITERCSTKDVNISCATRYLAGLNDQTTGHWIYSVMQIMLFVL